jgi:hypothetical protein
LLLLLLLLLLQFYDMSLLDAAGQKAQDLFHAGKLKGVTSVRWGVGVGGGKGGKGGVWSRRGGGDINSKMLLLGLVVVTGHTSSSSSAKRISHDRKLID